MKPKIEISPEQKSRQMRAAVWTLSCISACLLVMLMLATSRYVTAERRLDFFLDEYGQTDLNGNDYDIGYNEGYVIGKRENEKQYEEAYDTGYEHGYDSHVSSDVLGRSLEIMMYQDFLRECYYKKDWSGLVSLLSMDPSKIG